MPADFQKIESNEATRTYFERFRHIGRMLESISEREAGEKSNDIDDQIILSHIRKLNKTLIALQAKYWFNGEMSHRQQSIFMIDTSDSGFPLRKEITEMSNDKLRADDILAELPTEQDIKNSILDYALSQKRVNKDLQYDLGMRMYYQLLKDNDLFMQSNPPVFMAASDSHNGNSRYVAHWSVYDVKKNIPNIYVMVFEYSGKGGIEENPEIFEQLITSIINNSSSELKLLTIGMNLDKEFPLLHPKSLKRVHVGPVYNNGITKHNDSIQSILDNVKGEKNNWVFGWSVETLLSRGHKRAKTGMFGDQQEEIFHVDSGDYAAFDAGATEIDQSMIIPYDVYQALADAKNNPLNQVNKYVVNDHGDVIFL